MSEKKREKGAAVRRAIQEMDGAELIVLCANMANAYEQFQPQTPNAGVDASFWANAIPKTEKLARESLLQAFKVSVKPEKREVRSPAVKRALEGIPPVDPVVRALSGIVTTEGNPPPF